jgi:predicted nucleic acid-binding protein
MKRGITGIYHRVSQQHLKRYLAEYDFRYNEDEDKKIEQLLRQSWIRPVVVDERIGVAARRAMRHHSQCKKPSDAIHLVTALALNVDEMNTYDGNDLLKLDGKVNRADGKPLKICTPTPAPEPPPPPPDLFQIANEKSDPKKG